MLDKVQHIVVYYNYTRENGYVKQRKEGKIMKTTFNEFILTNPNCSGYEDNKHAKDLFNLLNQDESIIAMIDSAEQGKPALAGVVVEVEKFFDGLTNPTIDLKDGFTRTVVGRMVRSILEPFGYSVSRQKDLAKGKNCKYFTSASCYYYSGNAKLKVVKKIVPVE